MAPSGDHKRLHFSDTLKFSICSHSIEYSRRASDSVDLATPMTTAASRRPIPACIRARPWAAIARRLARRSSRGTIPFFLRQRRTASPLLFFLNSAGAAYARFNARASSALMSNNSATRAPLRRYRGSIRFPRHVSFSPRAARRARERTEQTAEWVRFASQPATAWPSS